MAGAPSTLGFGFQLYGFFPYGSSDWSEEVTWKILPPFWRDYDAYATGQVPDPVRKWMDVIKPSLEDLRQKWSIFPDLMDPLLCPLSNLPQLAYTVGLPEQDEARSERLRRTEILNAPRLYVNKGTDLGYEIFAGFEGLVVEITPLWADDCGDAPATLSENPTLVYAPSYADFAADEIPADTLYDDAYAEWPNELELVGVCRTNKLRLRFFDPNNLEIEDFGGVAERLISSLDRVKPIHVEIDSITFDGPTALGGGWEIPVVVDNAAMGGGWEIPVQALPTALGGGWEVPLAADLVP